MSEERNIEVLKMESTEDNEITLTINASWGPIVSAPTLPEAKEKLREGFIASLIAMGYWTVTEKEEELDKDKMKGNFRDFESSLQDVA